MGPAYTFILPPGGPRLHVHFHAWVDRELGDGDFPDRRLKACLGKLLAALGRRIGGTLPAACQDWAATKAAYRFFSNPRVDEGVILAGHFAATRARFAATAGPVLVLHDTTEFSFTRDNPEAIGQLSLLKTRHATVTLCGLLMHSSLVLTPEGVPLGLAAVKFWTRDKFKGTNAPEAEGQSHPDPDRAEGERPLAGEPQAVHGAIGRPLPVRPHRRPRERHLRAVLRRPGGEDPFPGPHLRGPAGRRRRHDHLRGDAIASRSGATTRSRSGTSTGGSRGSSSTCASAG